MDATRFDLLARTLAMASSRRQALSALLLGGVALTHGAGESEAGPGCKNVGKKCKKKKDCCSGICKGKKGKKKCKAHDTGGCLAGQQQEECGGDATIACTTSAGETGFCETTTGNAAYCAADIDCFACTKDADCRPFCGPQAACVACTDCPGGVGCAATDSCEIAM
jgi:hypothetical protein